MFWIIVGIILVVVLGTALWTDRKAKRRHGGSINPLMRSRDEGVNDVMGKDYGAFTPRHATDQNGGHGIGGL